jgi:hypothetical protein
VAPVRKRTIPTERPQIASEVSANFFADGGCHVVSVTNPYGRILGFANYVAGIVEFFNFVVSALYQSDNIFFCILICSQPCVAF